MFDRLRSNPGRNANKAGSSRVICANRMALLNAELGKAEVLTMEDHFIYVRGYPDAIAISGHEEMRVRDALVGQQTLDYVSIVAPDKKLLVRVSDIAVLESRPKVSV